MPRQDEHEPQHRVIVEDLDSVGLVVAGANGPADIMITKAVEKLELGAIRSHSTKTSDKSWDAGAARRRLPNQASALKAAHAWVDSSADPDAKSSYKFPHHDAGGAANLAAVRNGLARLEGSKIPASDKDGVRAHLARHLRDGGGEPAEKGRWARIREWLAGPVEISIENADETNIEEDIRAALEFVAGDPEELEKARNLGQLIESQIHSDFTMRADGMYGDGMMTREERIALSSAIGVGLEAFTTALEAGAPQLFTRDPYDFPAEQVAMDEGAPIAQDESPDTLANESKTKEANVPDITLSDEAREGLDETAKAYVEHLEAELAKAAEDTPPVETDDGDDLEKALDGLPEDVAAMIKAQNEAAEAEVAKAREEAQTALATAEALKAEKLRKEYLTKAGELSELGKAEELAPVLLKAETGQALNEDEAATLAATLKRANEVIATSSFFDEFGKTGGGSPNSAIAIIRKKAAELKAANPGMTIEQAERDVMTAEPELAQRADAEERERVGR